MKNNLLKYILVLSLLLNASLLGAAGYTYYRQSRHPTSPFNHGHTGQVPMTHSAIHSHLFEALALKPDQRELFEQKALAFHEALDKKGEEVDRLRNSLFDIMETDAPDGKTIEKTIAEMNGVQEDMQKMAVAHMLQFKSMLDKSQQKKFFDLIQEATMGGHEIGRP
jgi:Spy/CpxP family protein refolding chaperone